MGDGDGRERVFQPAGFWKWWRWLYGGLMCFNGLFVGLNNVGSGGWWRAIGVAVACLVGAFGVWIMTFTPKTIRLDDSGARLVAVARTTSIPWDELEAVRPAISGLGNGLIWTRWHGHRVITSCTWEHQPEMLEEIQRHLDEVARLHARGTQVVLHVVPRGGELVDRVGGDRPVDAYADLSREHEQALGASQLDLVHVRGQGRVNVVRVARLLHGRAG